MSEINPDLLAEDYAHLERTCPKLSTGADSTLGNWRDLTAAVFGTQHAGTKFLEAKIAEQGRDEWVLSDERQLLVALWQMGEQP